ncbi:MAG: GRAS family protein [Sphaerospermopsis sp. SIO1G1]|nr:GRAS family protein [Sphaerospermopsis sp. SIO1G1]
MTHPLFEVVHHLQMGNIRTAYHLLHSLVFDHKTQTKEFVFADALQKKLDFNYIEQGNVYFSKYEDYQGSQIDIFDVVAKVPIFTYSYLIGNPLLVEYIITSGLTEVAYMDLGLGKGSQAIAVMELVAQSNNPPQKFTVIGLEPVPNSLETAKVAIEKAGKSLPFTVDFVGIDKCAEDLTEEEWEKLQDNFGGKVAINAAYSIHHIVSEPHEGDERDRVLRHLYDLHPLGFVLLEGNANHNIEDFFLRFQNCWQLYGTVFDMVDDLDELTNAERVALKIGFFGREIEDIISEDEMANRHERLEPLSVWVERLVKAGFYLKPQILNLPKADHPKIGIRQYRGYVGVEYNYHPIVGVIAAQVNKSHAS